jgi:Uma2 family endonuclease
MAVIEKIRITLDEFRAIVDRSENAERRLELIDGEIVEKPVRKPIHDMVFHLIYMLLSRFLETNPIGQILAEVQFEKPGANYAPIPDIAIVLHTQPAFDLHENIPYMPALAIEIQSPTQTDREMIQKAYLYLEHGGLMVWLFYPDRKLIEVLTPTERKLLTVEQVLEDGDVLPGLNVKVAELFPR